MVGRTEAQNASSGEARQSVIAAIRMGPQPRKESFTMHWLRVTPGSPFTLPAGV